VRPSKNALREKLSEAMSLSPGPWRFLTIVLLAWDERLKELDDEAIHLRTLKKPDDDAPWFRRLNRNAEDTLELVRQMRRAMRYLCLKPKLKESKTQDDAMWLGAAEWVRAYVERGDSDDQIATLLKDRFETSPPRKRGRPSGTSDPGSHVMLAFRLREAKTAYWSYPKLADHLCECKCRRPHTADSPCVDKLKKAVKRLRDFLQELGYEGTGK
jgi:hypothetical protein